MTLAGGLAVAPAADAARVPLLPTVARGLTAAKTTSATCSTARPGARGIASATYVAPMSGYVTARLAGKGDWDLRVRDAASKRSLGASQGFRGNEIVQTWVQAGQRLVAEGCRHAGASRTARVGFTLADVKPPSAPGTPSLVRVHAPMQKIQLLEEQGFDVTHNMREGYADVLVSGAAQLDALKKTGLRFTTRIANMNKAFADARAADRAYTQRMGAAGSPLPSGRTEYRTVEETQADLKKLVADHPDRVRPVVIGKTFQGREIMGVEIANNVKADDGRPVYFLMGEHHAREWPSGEAALEFAVMLANANGDARLEKLLNTERVVVVPIVNVDGTVATKNAVDPADEGVDPAGAVSLAEIVGGFGGFNAYRRKNCDGEIGPPETPCELTWGIDNNRNYGNLWGGPGSSADRSSQSYHGPGPRSEPETQAVWNFTRTHQVTMLMTLHTVAALVLRPPGLHDGGLAPDEQRMKAIGDAMADATGYTSQYSWQLYDTAGTTEDDTYAATGGYGYTIEIGPEGGNFHEAYETGVVNEWTGNNDKAKGRGGLREALLIAAESAADPADHAVFSGKAPAGKVLRLKKAFDTKTSPFCDTSIDPAVSTAPFPVCLTPENEALTLKDTLDTTTKVPGSGTFDWHVGQSTRPFVNGGATKLEQKDDPPFATIAGEPGAPTSDVDYKLTVPANLAGERVHVHLANALPEDYDVTVLRGEKTIGSSGNPPGEPEDVLIDNAQAGDYTVRVNYFAAASGQFTINGARTAVKRTVTTGTKEAYDLTCENPDGTVLERRQLIIDRGDDLSGVTLGCGSGPSTFADGSPLPALIVASKAPKGGGASVVKTVGSAKKVSRKLGVRVLSTRLRKGRLAVRVTCPKGVAGACKGTLRVRGVVGGRKVRTLGTKRFSLKAGKAKTLRVRVSKALVKRLRTKRVKVTVSGRAVAGAVRLTGSRKATLRR